MKEFKLINRYCGMILTIEGYDFEDAVKRNHISLDAWARI
jgi:hypothetical protein